MLLLSTIEPKAVIIIAAVLFIIILVQMYLCLKRVKPDQCIVRSGMGGVRIVFEKIIPVYPIIHRYDVIDLKPFTFSVKPPLQFKDEQYKDISCEFTLVLEKNTLSVLNCVEFLGLETLKNNEKFSAVFTLKFEMCMVAAAVHFNYDDILKNPKEFKDTVNALIGKDLYGLKLDRMTLSTEDKL